MDLSNFDNYHGGSVVLNGGAGNDYIVAEGGECNAFQDGNSPIEVLCELHGDTRYGGEGNDTLIATNGGNLTGGEAECSRYFECLQLRVELGFIGTQSRGRY